MKKLLLASLLNFTSILSAEEITDRILSSSDNLGSEEESRYNREHDGSFWSSKFKQAEPNNDPASFYAPIVPSTCEKDLETAWSFENHLQRDYRCFFYQGYGKCYRQGEQQYITYQLAQLLELLDQGYDVNRVDEKGHTLLHKAALRKNNTAIELLANHRAFIDSLSDYNDTPLLSVMNYCLDGACPLAREQLSQEALEHFEQRIIETIQLLLALGADIAAQNVNGHTALYQAIQRGFKNVALFLIQLRAEDPKAYNLALKQQDYEVIVAMRKTLRKQRSPFLYKFNLLLNDYTKTSGLQQAILLDHYKDLCTQGESAYITLSASDACGDEELIADNLGLYPSSRATVACQDLLGTISQRGTFKDIGPCKAQLDYSHYAIETSAEDSQYSQFRPIG